MKRTAFFAALAGTTAVLTLLDQISKNLADRMLAGRGMISVAGEYFVLVYARNRGAFLSLGSGTSGILWPLLFIVFPVAIILVFLGFVWKRGDYSVRAMALASLVTAGGLGNILDRVRLGSVRDFMNLGIGNFRTGIFNVADLYLMIFVGFVLVFELGSLGRQKDRHSGSAQEGDSSGSEAPPTTPG